MYLYLYFRNFFSEKHEGQDLVEYSLILGLIAVAATALLITTGESVEDIWTAVEGAVSDAAAAVPAAAP